ncbi:MAG: DUF1611 domain-containing protein [Saprospiraceae bacterium]|nr:DUF1611 domain-containing protein [Saprospiraceae bacterium]
MSMSKIAVKPITFPGPYLIFLGDLKDRVNAKTGQGLADWRPEMCLGQLRLDGCTIDLGLPDMDISLAAREGVRSMVIGIAPVGGGIKEEWIEVFAECLKAGINIVNGLHTQLADIPTLSASATLGNAQIYHVRTPPSDLLVGTGRKRSGKRVLMVGTDCGVGKKYSALCIHRALQERGISATFRATGQTGIMIAGSGIPIDSIVVDFVTGAAELLSPDNEADHWDVIEGQGALHHPGYGAVSLGLMYGSQPDAIVLCHEATRTRVDGFPGYHIGDLTARIEEALLFASKTNPNVFCAGISVNTSWLEGESTEDYLAKLEKVTGLPCVDPMRGDLDLLLDRLLEGK